MDLNDLVQWIKNYEGCKLRPYKDIVGKTTIGYGRNLDDDGISLDEADLMFQNDLWNVMKVLTQMAWFKDSPQNVQCALANMAFNLGMEGLLDFKDMIHALIAKDYTKASQCALDSKWAKELPKRANDIAVMMREA